jgi:hypothetical protein
MKHLLVWLIAAFAASLGASGVASATTAGASGSVAIYWNLESAIDENGDPVDGTNAVLITGRNALFASSAVSAAGISSLTDQDVYTIRNISTNISIFWTAGIEAMTRASTSHDGGYLGRIYSDANSFVTVGSISSFAAVTNDYACTNNNPTSPNFDCFGYNQGRADGTSDFLSGMLAPGETLSFELAVQSFATLRITPVSPVPLPGAALLLASGLVGLPMMRRRRLAVR